VALNHPRRWLQKAPTGTNPQQVWFNCPLGFTSSATTPACTPTQATPNPKNVAGAVFYQMKGLFVTPGTTGEGPQITMATVGDTVTLQVRVYNYSLANMPANTTVQVQFYAQPWDATTGQFLSASGNANAFAPAVFIGQTAPEPIPAFCGGPRARAIPAPIRTRRATGHSRRPPGIPARSPRTRIGSSGSWSGWSKGAKRSRRSRIMA
jgi:hypothetical protein